MPAHKAEFSTLRLDGSAVHAAWAQLYTRCAEIIRRARKQKAVGTGCFARPESDIALLQLLATMDAIDPEAGWLESGMLTYLYSLDDALRRADEVWWGHDWLDPARGTHNGPFAECNAAALLKKPYSVEGGMTQVVRLLIGAIELVPPRKPDRETVARRRALFDALQLRAQVARGFLQRPDKSYPKVKPIDLPAIPQELGEPLWRNASFPDWPESGLAKRRRFGHVLARGLAMAMDEAVQARTLTPRFLGLQMLPGEWDPKEIPLPHLKYWLDCGPFRIAHGLLDAAILDRLMGAEPVEMLQAGLGFSRYLASQTRWSLPYAPKWLNVEQWDAAVIGAAVGDEVSLAVWREHSRDVAGFPPGTRACNRVLAEWTNAQRWPPDLKLPKSLDKFESGFVGAMRGLCDRDAAKASAGVREMLEAYGRVDYRQVRGHWYSRLCLQAVAVQRMAGNVGLRLEVPPDAPNDPDLVIAPDPTVAALPWVPLPGIDLVCNAEDPLAWPSLYLNSAVREVIEPPID